MLLSSINNKILVLGSPGVGKTYFSNILSKKLKIKVFHLDDYYWHQNWHPSSRESFEYKLKKIFAEESFIIDGNYIETLPLRMIYANTIIYINSGILYAVKGFLIRILRKWAKQIPLGHKREYLTEKGILFFIWYIVKYNLFQKKNVLQKIKTDFNGSLMILSHNETKIFIEALSGTLK